SSRYVYTVVFIISLAVSSADSALISTELQGRLVAAGSSDEIAVVVNLADSVRPEDISAFSGAKGTGGKAARYGALVGALKDKADRTQGEAAALLKTRGAKNIKPLWLTNSVAATVPASLIDEISGLSSVGSIEPDTVIRAPAFDSLRSTPWAASATEWNISRIKAPSLWNAGLSGTGIVVASLDTGVDVTHPDLHERWRGGACATPPDCDSWYDPHTNSTVPYDRAGSSFAGHGTGVMGLMLGSSQVDRYGVAPEAAWISAKIFDDSGLTSVSTIISALQWLLAPGGNPANAPDVVNNSWGFDSTACEFHSALDTAIRTVRGAGMAVVFSAGNRGPGPSTSASPANYSGNFAVGASDFSDAVAGFSSRGPSACPDRTTVFPNIVAPGTKDNTVPGVGIYTSAPAGAYRTVQGTSFSAPHVSGAMALLLSAFPSLTPSELETSLEQTATGLGAPVPNNDSGHGLLNIEAAYKDIFIAIKGDVSEIASSPPSMAFGDVASGTGSPVVTFLIANRGTADLAIDAGPGGVTMSGADPGDFIISADACSGVTLPSLGSCSVSAYFRPVTVGPKNALLQVASDDPLTSVLDVPLSGTGVSPFSVALVRSGVTVGLYSSIQTAYGNSQYWDIIKLRNTTITEDPDFNLVPGIAVSLIGGYDSGFGSRTGLTVISGTLTIRSGTVTVENIILR
ncbi:MAG: S8 family serine peptidase, partial [Nitrospirae bacterium]|nr:S8 family serine peptidase [Nitrospirota bacterium]